MGISPVRFLDFTFYLLFTDFICPVNLPKGKWQNGEVETREKAWFE